MRNSQHLKHTILSAYKGVNNDIIPELRGQLEGLAYDMINARVDPENIGEVFPIGGYGGGTSVGNISPSLVELVYVVDVGGKIIALYNFTIGATVYGAIAIDLTIVAQSEQLVFSSLVSVDFSVEHSKLFIADGNDLPLILDIQDMLDSSVTQKYFGDFLRADYSTRFTSEMSPPRFQRLVAVGNGLKIGSYIYMYRYVDKDGNRTGWSVASATIPVVMNEDREVRQLTSTVASRMGWKTYGGDPGEVSKYGIVMKVRVVNTAGFSYVELGRFSYITGGPFGDIASFGVTPLLVDDTGISVDISVSDVTHINFMDSGGVLWEPSSDFSISQLSSIKSVDALRYFADRLVFMGITYTDMELTDKFSVRSSFKTDEGVLYNVSGIFPFMNPIGRAGHRVVYNQVYKKSYIHREYRGYGIIFDDGAGKYSQAIPITTNFVQMPHACRGMLNYESEYTQQVHRKYRGITPDFNALAGAPLAPFSNTPRVFAHWNDYDAVGTATEERAIYQDYSPFTPINKADNACTFYANRYETNAVLYRDNGKKYPVPISAVQGYYPEQFSLGVCLPGIDWENLPSWVKGFSIVQTEYANNVIAQGIAMYNIEMFTTATLAPDFIRKTLNKLVVHFPDLDTNIGISPDIVDDLISNPQNYYLQLMIPVGFFSEGYVPQGPQDDIYERDFLTMATVMHPGKTNPNDSGRDRVDFGSYRYIYFPTANVEELYNSDNLEESYSTNITSVSIHRVYTSSSGDIKEMPSSRTTMLLVETEDNIYNTSIQYPNDDSNHTSVRQYHEPWYVVNLMRKSEGVRNTNISKYISFGHHQPIRYTIGIGTGDELVIPLINDRVNDILYVDGRAWYLHTSDLDWTTSAPYVALKTSESYVATDMGVTVYGIARWRRDDNGNFEILFSSGDGIDDAKTIPTVGDIIEMRYNKYSPIEIMGGDHVVSESHAAYVDLTYRLGNIKTTDGRKRSTVNLNCGYPLAQYWSNINTSIRMDQRVRQWVIQSLLLTRTNIPFITNNAYPNRQYLVKIASAWFHKDISGDNADTLHARGEYIEMVDKLNIAREFVNDNLDQMPYMGYGGFVLPQAVNIDYSKRGTTTHYTLPSVGFTPEYYFPNRIMWSMSDNMITQDTPGLRTVLATAVYDTKVENGALIRAFHLKDVQSGVQSGDLYVLSRGGVCRLITNRTLINSVDDNVLATMPKEGVFIQREDWISRTAKLPEGFENVPVERNDALYFISDKDVYQLTEAGLKPISTGYSTKIREFIELLEQGGQSTWSADYDRYGEIIFTVGANSIVFNHKLGVWVGTRNYGDTKAVVNNTTDVMYGYNQLTRRDTDMYDGSATAREMQVSLVVADAPTYDKEFVDINVISSSRPNMVEFGTDKDTALTSSVHIDHPATNNTLYMKQYGKGWWTYIPVRLVDRVRQQGNYLMVNIRHTTNVKNFVLKLVEIGWKLIK